MKFQKYCLYIVLGAIGFGLGLEIGGLFVGDFDLRWAVLWFAWLMGIVYLLRQYD